MMMADYNDEDVQWVGYYLITYAYRGEGHPAVGPFATVAQMALSTGLTSYPRDGYVIWKDEDGSISGIPSLNPDDLVAAYCRCGESIYEDGGFNWCHESDGSRFCDRAEGCDEDVANAAWPVDPLDQIADGLAEGNAPDPVVARRYLADAGL